ncbi:hypothetical protein FOA52_003975 [Chlamydomonas sp. UWO 241]|nr:hypothetical protein FOA52_003975 [Chlamydomonas sp. UWO 241]
MLPALREASERSRLFDLVPPVFLGPPAWYVSHAWAGSFIGLVDALSSDLAPEPGPTEPPMPEGFKDGVYVAIDLFAVNLYASQGAPADAAAAGCALLGACSTGLVLVVDVGLASLQRLWCLYEVFWAAQHGMGGAVVRVALPRACQIEDVVGLHEALCAGLDLTKAECARDKDATHLLSELRHKRGMQRSNMLVTEALRCALHSKLRWRASVWGWAMFAVLNLRGDDHLPLQQLLASWAELGDNEASLKEVRLIFQAYDEDGSGELDEKEFIEVLMKGGYSEAEAVMAFVEVNTDGEGGVSMEEYEVWWREQAGNTERTEPTLTALLGNLDALAAYMDRLGMTTFAAHFRAAAAGMAVEKAAAGPRAAAREALSAPAPRGGLVAALDDVFERMDDDRRGAAKVMYRLLLSNCELLATDTDAAHVPPPESAPHSAVSLADKLRMYMEIAHAMLLPHAATLPQQRETLHEVAAELRKFVASNGTAEKNSKSRRSLAGNRALLRQTMQAMYGENVVMSPRAIRETQMAISQMVAANKVSGTGRPSVVPLGSAADVLAQSKMQKFATERLPTLSEVRERLYKADSGGLSGLQPRSTPARGNGMAHSKSVDRLHDMGGDGRGCSSSGAASPRSMHSGVLSSAASVPSSTQLSLPNLPRVDSGLSDCLQPGSPFKGLNINALKHGPEGAGSVRLPEVVGRTRSATSLLPALMASTSSGTLRSLTAQLGDLQQGTEKKRDIARSAGAALFHAEFKGNLRDRGRARRASALAVAHDSDNSDGDGD